MFKNLKPQHRPLVAHRILSVACFLALFIAFILYLLVALSLPIIKSVYLLSLKSIVKNQPQTSTATELRFGVWGVCASSVLNQPSLLTNGGECYGPKLGYTVPAPLLSLIGSYSSLANVVLKGLLVLLILHPIIAALSLLSFTSSLFLASHTLSILSLITTLVTALLSSIVFATDLAIVIGVRDKVQGLKGLDFEVGWGNGVWMMCMGVGLTWLAVCLLSARACYCCGVRRKEPEPWYSEDDLADTRLGVPPETTSGIRLGGAEKDRDHVPLNGEPTRRESLRRSRREGRRSGTIPAE